MTAAAADACRCSSLSGCWASHFDLFDDVGVATFDFAPPPPRALKCRVSTAYSALILIPCKPTMHPALMERMRRLAQLLPQANPTVELMTVVDYRREPAQPGDRTAWSRVTRIRNRLLDSLEWQRFTHVIWIDADLWWYPPHLPTLLIGANPGGITAPMVDVDDMPRHFYDTAAFTIDGVHFKHADPWCDAERWRQQTERFAEVDSVGCVYSVSTDVYRAGARHEDHPTNTDHWPICCKAREMGRQVLVDRFTWVQHANLPRFGEAWHT